MSLRLLPAILTLAAAAAAQSASYGFYGTACAVYAPPFDVRGTPRVGGSFDVLTRTGVLRGVVENTEWVLLLTGAQRLAFDLTLLSDARRTGCGFLLCSPDVMLLMPFAQTFPQPHTVRIAVPGNASLLGTTFFQQMVMVSRFGFSFTWRIEGSRGGVGVIGR